MDKNTRVLVFVLSLVIGMGALAYASVPLYDLFCRVTGFAGTTQTSDALPDTTLDREIVIRFNSQTSANLPWEFKAETYKVTTKIGAQGLVNFYAENKSSTPTTGTAVYNVTPLKAGKYFHKTQCFCFDEQTLTPNQRMNMPVLFYIDPSIAEDRNMDDVHDITLSYSFFPAESKELDGALEAFYNAE